MMGSAVVEMGSELELCAMRAVAVGFVKKVVTESRERGRQVWRLEESIKSLEEEKRKIEAFKRELPLCMRLVCEVIEELKREIDRCRAEGFGRVFQEFMPIKGKIHESSSDFRDKKNWTSSFQLWICEESKDDQKHDKMNFKEKSVFDSRNGGDTSLPVLELYSSKEDDESAAVLSDLSLCSTTITHGYVTPAIKNHPVSCHKYCTKESLEASPAAAPGTHYGLHLQQKQPRKMRRCWSQELHRRFVLATEELGGAHVATPKQIREMMLVDELTNDEVKSHLQKYRLHTQKTSRAIDGGLRVPEEQYTNSSHHSVSQSISPMSPLHSGLHGDSSEDGKSESYSCK
ncbi:hypothetical protein ZIOFF_042785 [Zingiber officinale]|uniref:HTH myb-type domain-containing protein n=2 Tax=Zingiber officinale TaxID=94328 RepID=A0A8J5KY76_ZINOF|nr:hypothetical protein ZIOFF_042785 [Zingiber officinale]